PHFAQRFCHQSAGLYGAGGSSGLSHAVLTPIFWRTLSRDQPVKSASELASSWRRTGSACLYVFAPSHVASPCHSFRTTTLHWKFLRSDVVCSTRSSGNDARS